METYCQVIHGHPVVLLDRGEQVVVSVHLLGTRHGLAQESSLQLVTPVLYLLGLGIVGERVGWYRNRIDQNPEFLVALWLLDSPSSSSPASGSLGSSTFFLLDFGLAAAFFETGSGASASASSSSSTVSLLCENHP